MKTMKKLLAAVLATVMLLGVTACGNKDNTPAADGDNAGTTSTTVLKMGHVYSEKYPMHLAMLAMADEVYEKTEGRYKIEICPNSSLGNESDLNEGVNIGTVDIIYLAALCGKVLVYEILHASNGKVRSGLGDVIFLFGASAYPYKALGSGLVFGKSQLGSHLGKHIIGVNTLNNAVDSLKLQSVAVEIYYLSQRIAGRVV